MDLFSPNDIVSIEFLKDYKNRIGVHAAGNIFIIVGKYVLSSY